MQINQKLFHLVVDAYGTATDRRFREETMSAEAPARWVAGDDPFLQLEALNLIARREYRVRGNLATLAAEILAGLDRAIRELPGESGQAGPSNLIAQYNLGSLLQLQYGFPGRALELCDKAIAVCFRLFHETGSARWLGEAFQPYINIGRLAGAKGELSRALEIFDGVFHFVTVRRDLVVAGQKLECARLLPPPGVEFPRQDVLFENYLQDTVKACLWMRQYERLLHFLGEVAGLPSLQAAPYRRTVAEGRIRALMGLRRFPEALEAGEQLAQRLGTDELPQPAIAVIWCEANRAAGRVEEARQALLQIVDCYSQLLAEPAPLTELRRFQFLVGLEYYRLRDLDEATPYLERALEMNRELGDEPGAMKCRIGLLRCASERGDAAAEDRWFDSLEESVSQTLYRQEQALALHEMAVFAASRGRAAAAEEFQSACLNILEPIPTLEAELLRSSSLGMRSNNPELSLINSSYIPTCQDIELVYHRLWDLDSELRLAGIS